MADGFKAAGTAAITRLWAKVKDLVSGKQDALTVAQLDATNSGITATRRARYDTVVSWLGSHPVPTLTTIYEGDASANSISTTEDITSFDYLFVTAEYKHYASGGKYARSTVVVSGPQVGSIIPISIALSTGRQVEVGNRCYTIKGARVMDTLSDSNGSYMTSRAYTTATASFGETSVTTEGGDHLAVVRVVGVRLEQLSS